MDQISDHPDTRCDSCGNLCAGLVCCADYENETQEGPFEYSNVTCKSCCNCKSAIAYQLSNANEETGEHAFATGSDPRWFSVSKTEPELTPGVRVWPVVGFSDSCARPMSKLTGSWGGKWWFRTGPNFTLCAHCGRTLRSKADQDTHGDWCAALG